MKTLALLALAAWSASAWSAAGQVALALGAIVAAGWAVFTYRRAKRAEAARWLQGLFRDFYTDGEMVKAREVLEYDFEEQAAHILELRVADRHIPLDEESRSILREVDLVLNFFEQLLYLESQGHLAQHDREVFFQYWFELLKRPSHAALRRYLARCGYERCAQWVGAGQTEHVAFYGSLMSAYGVQDELGIRGKLEHQGPCTLDGRLYSRRDFPCMTQGNGRVHGELFMFRDPEIFRYIDPVEHYDPADLGGSMYRRQCVRLIDPSDTDAWVYVWNQSTVDLVEIPDGSWSRFQNERSNA
jgi:gamma-glutamylcyclotransferase (GGCT)/AIG2-like uncharacterized protein YtfP